jgi:LPXTG-motif cell wall-anchored protein
VASLGARAGIGALGTVGLFAVGVASPAGAALPSVEGCGDEHEGAVLTRDGDVCQLAFTTPGEYEWTVPAGLAAIHAVLTGAGGGAQAYVAGGDVIGYAGSGGSVIYADLSDVDTDTDLILTIDAGSSPDDTGFGEGTGISAGTVEWFAARGVAGTDGNDSCQLETLDAAGFSTFLTVGNGAKGAPAPEDRDCDAFVSPGILPASDDDSRGRSPLTLFADFPHELGRGGSISLLGLLPVSMDSANGTGAGADVVFIDSDDGPLVHSSADRGDNGSIFIRYAAEKPELRAEPEAESDASPRLPATGVEATPLAILLAALIGVGAALMGVRRRMSLESRS